MKKSIFLFLLIIFFSISVYSQDFRNVSFGMSMQEVKNRETDALYAQEGNQLFFTTKIAGSSMIIIYEFWDNELARGTLIYDEKHANDNLYYEKFKEIKSLLSQKYGSSNDDVSWYDNLYKDDPSEIGFAISIGHVRFDSEWVANSKCNVKLILTGDNYKISLGVVFSNKYYEGLLQKAKSNSDLNKI